MIQLSFFVPSSHLESVKQALFDAGAGRVGDYDSCAWQTLGQGQFRPLPGSDPFLGKAGEIACVEEYKVELICEDAVFTDVVAALKAAHPYEEPAYSAYRSLDI